MSLGQLRWAAPLLFLPASIYQGYMASRLAAFSRHRWLPYCLVGIVWVLQHSFLPFIPDWRLVLYRCLAFLPGVLVYMVICLRTRRLAPLIIAHWMMDLTAVFMTFPSETGRTKKIALAKHFPRGQFSFCIVVAYILTEPGCTLPLAPPA